ATTEADLAALPGEATDRLRGMLHDGVGAPEMQRGSCRRYLGAPVARDAVRGVDRIVDADPRVANNATPM
ncbi:hypothetical protein, partial [Nocardia sp. NPDC004860]|uniref:hypothetical protein n=1 Tax=Nocardia sp. NPDC004860 TaxID=3154557 RepID=UPI0033AB8C6A